MIVLTNEWHKGTMARAVPGARYSSEHGWVLDSVAPRSAAVALKLFPELNQHRELVEARDSLMSDLRPFDSATPWVKQTGTRLAVPQVRERVADQWSCPQCSYHVDVYGKKSDFDCTCPVHDVPLVQWRLFPYQEIDLAYADAVIEQHGAFYLGWERGLGKTLGTCVLLESLDVHAGLIVCPNTAKDSVWGEEVRRFCPWLEVIVLGNTAKKREQALMQATMLHDTGKPFVLVVHYEALAVIAGKEKYEGAGGKNKTRIGDGWKKLGIDWDLVVTDEDHRLSNPDTQMFRAARKVPHEKLLLLSGSIIQNELEELFSPHHRAFPDRYKSKWRDWNDRFLDYVENGFGKVCVGVKPNAVEPLRQELGVWLAYRRKEDELDLPPKHYVERRIPLTASQQKVYDQLRDECLAQLTDGSLVKAEAGVAMMTRLRQVATGLDLVGDVADSSKLDAALDDILDNPDSEFVMFSWYKAAVWSLEQRLIAKGVQCFAVTGDTPKDKRSEYVRRFNKGMERRVFIGTLATLGESVNLQRANNVGRLDRSFNPMLNVQAEDRCYRQGQKRSVTITDYIAKDTVDELHVMPLLASKEALRAAILGGA